MGIKGVDENSRGWWGLYDVCDMDNRGGYVMSIEDFCSFILER